MNQIQKKNQKKIMAQGKNNKQKLGQTWNEKDKICMSSNTGKNHF